MTRLDPIIQFPDLFKLCCQFLPQLVQLASCVRSNVVTNIPTVIEGVVVTSVGFDCSLIERIGVVGGRLGYDGRGVSDVPAVNRVVEMLLLIVRFGFRVRVQVRVGIRDFPHE